jgi:hypothetical protein
VVIGKLIGEGYLRNQRIIEAHVEGLTHADTLRQSPYNVNCMNWVLGHIANGRDDLLEILGRERLMSESSAARYRRESEPITGDGPEVLSLDSLMRLLGHGQGLLSSSLEEMSPEDLGEEVEWSGASSTLAEWSQFFYFHDTYHVGQIDLLRQLSGKSDKII